MLSVEDNQSILCLYFQGGQSINEISKALNINWRTTAKRIKEFEALRKLPKEDLAKAPQKLLDYLEKGTTYDSSTRKPRVLSEEIVASINAHLLANEEKRRNGLRKQQLKKRDIHEQLIAAGNKIDYSIIFQPLFRGRSDHGYFALLFLYDSHPTVLIRAKCRSVYHYTGLFHRSP